MRRPLLSFWHFLKFCCFWIRFVILTYPILALFEILLFLDTFCNTNVSDYRTGEFGLSAWTLSLLSYLEKSIYQNSRIKSRALSRASAKITSNEKKAVCMLLSKQGGNSISNNAF